MGAESTLPRMTARETEILSLLADRLTNREIADRLYISVRTVESHVSSLLTKLGAPNRRQLAVIARRVEPDRPNHNLPVRRNSFLGRDDEIPRVGRLLETHRLVTLVGPPGVGKTRLAIEAARDWVDQMPEGVWLVELAALTDPDLVTVETLTVLGGQPIPGQSPLRSLVELLRGRHCLLVLDNCEHLQAATAEMAEAAVGGAEEVLILATSRIPLGVSGETLVSVEPLEITDETDDEMNPAIRLFLDRASAVDAEIGDSVDFGEVATLVRRLDAIPLAIELAASRARMFTPAELAAQLETGFTLLEGPGTDRRYHTLDEAIAWSYRLLEPEDQTLLGRLSVFAGTFSLAAAQTVCADDTFGPADVAVSLARLADHSLVTPQMSGAIHRYRLLEPIRAFATSHRSPEVERSHAVYYADLGAEAAQGLTGRDQQRWIGLLQDELANVRAALEWSERNDPDLALRLFGSIFLFWEYAALRWEGVRWAKRVFALPGVESPAMVRALAVGSWLTVSHDSRLTQQQAGRAMSTAERIGDCAGYHRAQVFLGWVLTHTDREAALGNLSEAISYFSEHGDRWWEALARIRRSDFGPEGRNDAVRARRRLLEMGDMHLYLTATRFLTYIAFNEGQLDETVDIANEALLLARRLGNDHEAAEAHRYLGLVALRRRNNERAHDHYDRAVPGLIQTGDLRCGCRALAEHALVHHRRGDRGRTTALLAESWPIAETVVDRRGMAESVAVLALQFSDETAVRLAASSAGLLDPQASPLASHDDVRRHLDGLTLESASYERAWTEGAVADVSELVAESLDRLDGGVARHGARWPESLA